ncbi:MULTISPECIES: Nif11-like leader peptide family natural product precursor [unclassified Prochlorococcus]|uniref:Nif11-like leader peptide family natural product precursor n=1 Tax=unclassified Prochlorococcus TaxID=2627481 RepID=UPI00053374C1|nr:MULTISPECIES: Nif11-like leader peptide family natural product precursor [unclassified Prochlorococcus]KGG27783.1 hypothetical protein EV13_1902 [Prochlorococcus sp. MIT 0702]KGG29658.1 hypothetical protein EV12_0069 [Prochlorococcus sp. MIT 0701]KGG34340.1 hypothetical protein EV14_1234 [Prochlorococcus sp. MIT 0703]
MSEDQLKAFIAKVQGDTSLQEQLKAEGADVVAIAKAAGFTITTEDLNSDRQQNLSELELEAVAGAGWVYRTNKCTAAPICSAVADDGRIVCGAGWYANQCNYATKNIPSA